MQILHQSQIFILVNYIPSFHTREGREAGGTSCTGQRCATEDWRPVSDQTSCITEIHTFISCSVTRHSPFPTLWFIIIATAEPSSFNILPLCKKFINTNCPHNDSFDLVHLEALLTRLSEVFIWDYSFVCVCVSTEGFILFRFLYAALSISEYFSAFRNVCLLSML